MVVLLWTLGFIPILSYAILGLPAEIIASSHFSETGVDIQTSIILNYKNAQSILHSGLAIILIWKLPFVVQKVESLFTRFGTHGKLLHHYWS